MQVCRFVQHITRFSAGNRETQGVDRKQGTTGSAQETGKQVLHRKEGKEQGVHRKQGSRVCRYIAGVVLCRWKWAPSLECKLPHPLPIQWQGACLKARRQLCICGQHPLI